MRKTVRPALIAVVALSLAGCLKPGKINLGSSESHESHGGKQASVAATPAKTVVQQTKQSLDPATQEQINAAVMSMLASGQTTPWKSATASGTVVPGKLYKQGVRFCRPYKVEITTKNHAAETIKQTACQGKKGWVIYK